MLKNKDPKRDLKYTRSCSTLKATSVIRSEEKPNPLNFEIRMLSFIKSSGHICINDVGQGVTILALEVVSYRIN